MVDGKAQNFSCDHCSGCMTSFATLGHMYVFGVDPVGPYHTDKHGGWPTRVPEVCLAQPTPLLTRCILFGTGAWDEACWQLAAALHLGGSGCLSRYRITQVC